MAGSYCAAAAKKAAVVAAVAAEAVAEAATEEAEDGKGGRQARAPPSLDKMAPRTHPPPIIPASSTPLPGPSGPAPPLSLTYGLRPLGPAGSFLLTPPWPLRPRPHLGF